MKFKHPSRRLFLGGAGAAVALPLLNSMRPRRARAAPLTKPSRMIAFYVPDGIHMADWTPSAVGSDYSLPPILAPLAPVKSKLLVASGLRNSPGRPDGAGDHAGGTGSFLSCVHVNKSETDISGGISMDQVAAQSFGDATRFASAQLGTDGGSSGGGCDSGYSCAYTRNISWAGPTTPMPKMVDPRAIFNVLFAGFDPNASAAEAARRVAYKSSVLDTVVGDSESLRNKLGVSDKAKLDEYLNGVRELEMRLGDTGPSCTVGAPPEDSNDFPTKTRQLLDLMALAIECDLTRVITFMLGNGGDNRSFPFLGITEGHHQLSHHQGNAALFPKISAINTWEVEQLSYFLQRLDAMDDGEGQTVLDNSLVFLSSEIEDGNSHSHSNLPVVVGGGGGLGVATGQHLRFDDQPLANLFISMLRASGVSIDNFGDDGNGQLDAFFA